MRLGFLLIFPDMGEDRVCTLKKKLSSIVRQKNSTTNNIKESVLLALTSTTDELRIAYMIAKMGHPLEFRETKGPDSMIGGERIKLIEAKSRFNRTHFGGTSNKSVKLTEKGIFSLLCRDAFPLLERAFGEQNTHIALLNLSHSGYGLMLPAHSYVNERKFELKKAIDEALTLSRTGEDSVVLYMSMAKCSYPGWVKGGMAVALVLSLSSGYELKPLFISLVIPLIAINLVANPILLSHYLKKIKDCID
jgi:hypothetical protein